MLSIPDLHLYMEAAVFPLKNYADRIESEKIYMDAV